MNFCMRFRALKSKLQTYLYGARPMCIQRVQEGSSGDAIGSSALKPGRVDRTGVTTDYVVSAAARIVGIVNPELSVIENIEGLGTEFKLSRFPDLKVFQQREVEVQTAWIIQEIPARIPEGEPARGHKLGRIAKQRAKAPAVVERLGQSTQNIGVGSRDAEPARYPGVVGQGNAGVAGAVDHRVRRPRCIQRNAGKFPAFDESLGTVR